MAADARLHKAVQGIDVHLKVKGRAIHAVVAREALEEHFGAGETPQGWLDAYRRNAAAIDAAIARRFRDEPREPVILRPGDL